MKNIKLYLTNTLTEKKELFASLDYPKIKMYVCGITPYDFAHLGHGRCYVIFDTLYRLLTFLGYQVSYCRNFTDIDDKLINKAKQEYNDGSRFLEIANKFIKAYHEDMDKLKCKRPQFEPRVTDNIQEIITFIDGLINNKMAYATDDGVYFDVKNFPKYGQLSHRNLDDLKAGARVEVRENKRSPLDFALWKITDTAPGWESPWGFGRPGWHIECSTLANKYLGKTLDIHGGGMDLIFPHHENEIAQSEGLHHDIFVKYWVHNAFVRIDKEKMSKSLGNFVTLKQVLDIYDPMLIRYYILIHHYRNPLDFSQEDIEASSKSYQKLAKLFSKAQNKNLDFSKLTLSPIVISLLEAICDDLNIARFFGIIFENIKYFEENLSELEIVKNLIYQVLGLPMELLESNTPEITAEIQALINKREEARAAKDWAKADEIRQQLRALGFEIQDKK